MVDENNGEKILKVVKIIVIFLISALIIFLIGSAIIKNYNAKQTEKYFKDSGYVKIANAWNKKIEANDKNNYTEINNFYNDKLNVFTKTEKINLPEYQQETSFQYNGDNKIKVTYTLTGDKDGESCFLIQSATYNLKDKNFYCTVDTNPNDCKLKCNEIKKSTEKVAKEIEEIKEKAKIK